MSRLRLGADARQRVSGRLVHTGFAGARLLEVRLTQAASPGGASGRRESPTLRASHNGCVRCGAPRPCIRSFGRAARHEVSVDRGRMGRADGLNQPDARAWGRGGVSPARVCGAVGLLRKHCGGCASRPRAWLSQAPFGSQRACLTSPQTVAPRHAPGRATQSCRARVSCTGAAPRRAEVAWDTRWRRGAFRRPECPGADAGPPSHRCRNTRRAGSMGETMHRCAVAVCVGNSRGRAQAAPRGDHCIPHQGSVQACVLSKGGR